MTAGTAVECHRIKQVTRRLLCDTHLPVKRIAARYGFGSEETLRQRLPAPAGGDAAELQDEVQRLSERPLEATNRRSVAKAGLRRFFAGGFGTGPPPQPRPQPCGMFLRCRWGYHLQCTGSVSTPVLALSMTPPLNGAAEILPTPTTVIPATATIAIKVARISDPPDLDSS